MIEAAKVLFGAVFTAVTALALGWLLLRWVRVPLFRAERWLFSFLLGSGCLSLLMVLLAAVHAVYRLPVVVLAMAGIAAAFYAGSVEVAPEPAGTLPRVWKWVFGAGFAVYAALYFVHAFAPEHSADGGTYHLGLVVRVLSEHGFAPIPEDVLKNMPAGAEFLFLFAFLFGKHSAAALVHFCFLIALPLLMVCFGRRFAMLQVGAMAALAVFAAPVVGVDGTAAYVDVMLTAALFGCFYLIEIWDSDRRMGTLVAAAVLAGFGCSIKYTGVVAPLYVIGRVAIARGGWRAVGAAMGVPAAFMLPWLVKNWVYYRNPVIPFADGIFPNPYVHVSFTNELAVMLRSYGIPSYWRLPWEVTMSGQHTAGFFGPAFLLAPLALVALRRREGRRMLLCSLVFLLPYPSNIGTRFLMPAAPMIALAMGMSMPRAVWLVVVAVQAVMSLPWVAPLYCYQYAWRLEEKIPLKQALRIQSQDYWLSRIHPGYVVDQMIEADVPQGEPVFSMYQATEAYTSRHIHASYLSGQGEVLQDAIFTGFDDGFYPSYVEEFSFPAGRFSALRLVQTKTAKSEAWAVSEFQMYRDGAEVQRPAGWRVRADPNPWDAELAFDGNLATRWRSWEPARPGMFMEVDFEESLDVDAAKVLCTLDQWATSVRLEGRDSQGSWKVLGDSPRVRMGPIAGSLRKDAVAELRRRGYRYLLVADGNFGAQDMRRDPGAWGLRLVDEKGGARLYLAGDGR